VAIVACSVDLARFRRQSDAPGTAVPGRRRGSCTDHADRSPKYRVRRAGGHRGGGTSPAHLQAVANAG